MAYLYQRKISYNNPDRAWKNAYGYYVVVKQSFNPQFLVQMKLHDAGGWSGTVPSS